MNTRFLDLFMNPNPTKMKQQEEKYSTFHKFFYELSFDHVFDEVRETLTRNRRKLNHYVEGFSESKGPGALVVDQRATILNPHHSGHILGLIRLDGDPRTYAIWYLPIGELEDLRGDFIEAERSQLRTCIERSTPGEQIIVLYVTGAHQAAGYVIDLDDENDPDVI